MKDSNLIEFFRRARFPVEFFASARTPRVEVKSMRRIQRDPVGWHVMNRGTRRLDLFHDEQDFSMFVTILRRAIAASGAVLWAFALMSNHYHLVVFASSRQLSACMMRINRLYSRYHNRRYGMIGHAFEGPYKAFAQPTPLLLLRTIAYVLFNPVDAGLVGRPEDYPWSSARDYLGLPGSPLHVDPSAVMSLVSKDVSLAWRYFHRAMDREAMRPKRRKPDNLTRTQIQAQQFEWLLEHAREADLSGEDPEVIAIYWGRRTGISVKAMATVLESRTPAQISVILCRFKKELENDPARASRLEAP